MDAQDIDDIIGEEIVLTEEDELKTVPKAEGVVYDPVEGTDDPKPEEDPQKGEAVKTEETPKAETPKTEETPKAETSGDVVKAPSIAEVLDVETETTVPVHVVRELREKRRADKARIAELEAQVQDPPSGVNDDVAPKAKDPLEVLNELDNEDFISKQQMVEMLQAQKDRENLSAAEVEKQKQLDELEAFNARCLASEETARKALTAEELGEGLDYDSVVSKGRANLAKGDLIAIRESSDPALETYNRCRNNTQELFDLFVTSAQTKTVEAEGEEKNKDVSQEDILSDDDFFDNQFAPPPKEKVS